MDKVLECDVAVIGGGLGGVAAAMSAVEAGMQVIITEPTDWIGGQVTSQAVSALDEHQYIESFGGTRAYYQFRQKVRNYYQERYGIQTDQTVKHPLNPGNGWVSRLCFEPMVGLKVLEDMLAPHIQAGKLSILLRHSPIKAIVSNLRIGEVILSGPDEERVAIRAAIFLDATETGDLLPLTQTPYVCGAEALEDTGEPHASQDGPHSERVQSFTWSFMVEHRPGENHIIRKPFGYEALRDTQPFTLTLQTREGKPRRFYMFEGDLPFWTYRRVLDSSLANSTLPGQPRLYDIAIINWDSNDYYKENFLDRSEAQQARIFNEAKRLSLSFLYWLQTEAPNDSAGNKYGYPDLRLVPEQTGTTDGLAKAPYIRESRRVFGYKRILEQDLIQFPGRGARAAHYQDTVGVGWYPIDLHRCAGDPTGGREKRMDFAQSLPFQIPLGALISPAILNLIMAAKNIATTHITNGAYRLHPVEWTIGEAAGALAAYCLVNHYAPRQVWDNRELTSNFQKSLLSRCIPIFWSTDLSLNDPDFPIIQACLAQSPPPVESPRYQKLQILPDEQISNSEASWLLTHHLNRQIAYRFQTLGDKWQNSAITPLSSKDLRMVLKGLDIPTAPTSEYPTLRQVCTLFTN